MKDKFLRYQVCFVTTFIKCCVNPFKSESSVSIFSCYVPKDFYFGFTLDFK